MPLFCTNLVFLELGIELRSKTTVSCFKLTSSITPNGDLSKLSPFFKVPGRVSFFRSVLVSQMDRCSPVTPFNEELSSSEHDDCQVLVQENEEVQMNPLSSLSREPTIHFIPAGAAHCVLPTRSLLILTNTESEDALSFLVLLLMDFLHSGTSSTRFSRIHGWYTLMSAA